MVDKKRFSIGEISQLCNINPKQLRYFDEKGIVVPEIRDENNRYRYYSQKQLEKILLVKEMRELGFPLQKIRTLLNTGDLSTLARELESHFQEVRKEIDLTLIRYDKTFELYKRVNRVQNMIREVPLNTQVTSDKYQFSIVDIPKRQLVFTRYHSYSKANDRHLNRRAELNSIIEKNGLVTVGPHMAIYHDNYLNQFNDNIIDCKADIERCMEISQVKNFYSACRIQNSFRAASTIFRGPYQDLKPVYEALKEWVEIQGMKTSGAAIEVYVVSATMTNIEGNFVTNILLPLAGYEV